MSAFHHLSPTDCLITLQATPEGLTSSEAVERLAKHGPNRLPEVRTRGALRRFLAHFHNVLIYVLIGAAVITGAMQHWVDTGVILAVVLANAVIGFIQEGKAEAAMAAIRGMLAPRAAVLRDGQRVSVNGDTLVPGDVVLMEAGDKVPADLRILEARGLAAQEAILTGESVPVEKVTDPVAAEAALGDRRSMLWSGTLVTQGTARGLVVATGAATEIGRIGGLLAGVEQLTTPLVQQMDHFARWLSILIILASGLLLAYGYFVGHHDFAEMFMSVVGVAVAAIPEGLPAVMTITLAIGVQAMAKRNAIVRRLPAIEAIGSVSVICTDKTGTLTRNEMVVCLTAEDADGSLRDCGRKAMRRNGASRRRWPPSLRTCAPAGLASQAATWRPCWESRPPELLRATLNWGGSSPLRARPTSTRLHMRRAHARLDAIHFATSAPFIRPIELY